MGRKKRGDQQPSQKQQETQPPKPQQVQQRQPSTSATGSQAVHSGSKTGTHQQQQPDQSHEETQPEQSSEAKSKGAHSRRKHAPQDDSKISQQMSEIQIRDVQATKVGGQEIAQTPKEGGNVWKERGQPQSQYSSSSSRQGGGQQQPQDVRRSTQQERRPQQSQYPPRDSASGPRQERGSQQYEYPPRDSPSGPRQERGPQQSQYPPRDSPSGPRQERGPQQSQYPPRDSASSPWQGRGQQQSQYLERSTQQEGGLQQSQYPVQGRGQRHFQASPTHPGSSAQHERGPKQTQSAGRGRDAAWDKRPQQAGFGLGQNQPASERDIGQQGMSSQDIRQLDPVQQPQGTPAKPSPQHVQKHEQQKPASRQEQKPAEVSKPQPSAVQLAIPQRKKLNSAGTAGRRILIETNHLALTLNRLKTAVHYDVTLEPDVPKRLLRVAVEEFRRKNYPNRYPAFDGKKNMYSSTDLPISDPFTDEVVVNDDGRDKTYKITVKFAALVDLSTVSQFFQAVASNRHLVTPQEAVQCLDIVLRSAPSLNCIPVGRSFFTRPTGHIIDLGEGMEMYYGFYQSAVLGWKPYLNVDVSHKAFPKSSNVIDLIQELLPNCNIQNSLRPFERDIVDKFMRTLKVQYEIPGLPATRRVMRVNELEKMTAREAQFKNDAGQMRTVEAYFQTEKKYRLKYPHLPCLWVGSKQREQRILIPPELCIVVPGQVTNRAMTSNQTSNMIKVAATSTDVRKDRIMQSIKKARYNEDPCVREFGFQISHEFTKIQARVLDSPSVAYANKVEKPSRGVWRAQKFITGKPLNNNWAIVSVDDRTKPPTLKEFAIQLIQSAKQVGMDISQPCKEVCMRLTFKKERQQLEELFSSCKDMFLVIVIIPSDNKDVYSYVKQVAELRVGTLTQCIKSRNAFRPKPATLGNILLKINAKLNGVNHALNVRPQCLAVPCMIMGADVTHPSPESRGNVPSVAAVTASHDPKAFQYNICWRLQPSTREIIDDLENIMKEHLLFFYNANKGQKPQKIIFYRDGVSEGQFEIVSNSEIQAIRRACSKLGDGSYQPKITFLVVQKRHHTRFFPTNPNDSEDRNKNVPAGTVVDTEITHPTALDFYLVSHASIQGVARPTKYRILWDDNDMNEDEIEQLTYHLCHLFTRCTRSVSYPAPTYYAHLAAARAKVYCENKQINMNALDREMNGLKIKEQVVKQLPMFFV